MVVGSTVYSYTRCLVSASDQLVWYAQDIAVDQLRAFALDRDRFRPKEMAGFPPIGRWIPTFPPLPRLLVVEVPSVSVQIGRAHV